LAGGYALVLIGLDQCSCSAVCWVQLYAGYS